MDGVTIDRSAASLQYHVLVFQAAGSRSSQNDNDIMHEICCLGALIYLETFDDFLRLQAGRLRASSLLHGALIQKLKSTLDMVDTTNIAPSRALTLWILFLGGAVCAGTKDRVWFVARLVKTIMKLQQLLSWEDAKSSLVKFLWVDRIHEHSCKDLWDEVQITLGVLFAADNGS